MRRAWSWFFRSPDAPVSAWRVLAWWECRRIPFNVMVGAYGLLCLSLFFWAITTSGRLAPGEDAVEPMAILAAPFGINLLYTLGWLVELPARAFKPDLTPRFGPRLLMLGLGLGVFLISLPAVAWGGIRVAQMVHVLR
jgi:hypothetical protein